MGALYWDELTTAWQATTLNQAPPEESLALLPDAYAVVCTDRLETFELALQGPDYTAVRSWQEAAPPGYNVNVA